MVVILFSEASIKETIASKEHVFINSFNHIQYDIVKDVSNKRVSKTTYTCNMTNKSTF